MENFGWEGFKNVFFPLFFKYCTQKLLYELRK